MRSDHSAIGSFPGPNCTTWSLKAAATSVNNEWASVLSTVLISSSLSLPDGGQFFELDLQLADKYYTRNARLKWAHPE